MKHPPVLVVDDEKNIRLTVRGALSSLDLETEGAVNGEEALAKMTEAEYGMVLLDLKMPGMDGLEVLRRIRDQYPAVPVALITAHGTIETAVEAMKLGAVDFLQKPFAPQEIRDLVSRVLRRQEARQEKSQDYRFFTKSARASIQHQDFDLAAEQLKTAISIDPGNPEAFNLLGAVSEMQQDCDAAAKYYRTAYWLDPAYEPSRLNIERITQPTEQRPTWKDIRLGSDAS
jgi:FixJ family two-component response regulator